MKLTDSAKLAYLQEQIREMAKAIDNQAPDLMLRKLLLLLQTIDGWENA